MSIAAASSLTPGDELADTVAALLEQLGENPDREGLLETPGRVAESLRYLTEGYAANPATIEGEEGITHDGRWIGGIAFGQVSKRFSDPAGGFEQTLAVWILAELLEESCHRVGELVTGRQR